MTNGKAIKRNNALLNQFYPITFGMPQRLLSRVDLPDFVKVNCHYNFRGVLSLTQMFGSS